MKNYRPGRRTFLHHLHRSFPIRNLEVTASMEDNLWHMIKSGNKFTLCGKKPRKGLYIEATPSQEVMERLTGRDDIMDCPDCKELARTINSE